MYLVVFYRLLDVMKVSKRRRICYPHQKMPHLEKKNSSQLILLLASMDLYSTGCHKKRGVANEWEMLWSNCIAWSTEMSLLVRNCASDTTTRDYVTLCPITDYDWPALESPIIDVGGGIGSLELALVKECPKVRSNSLFSTFQKLS